MAGRDFSSTFKAGVTTMGMRDGPGHTLRHPPSTPNFLLTSKEITDAPHVTLYTETVPTSRPGLRRTFTATTFNSMIKTSRAVERRLEAVDTKLRPNSARSRAMSRTLTTSASGDLSDGGTLSHNQDLVEGQIEDRIHSRMMRGRATFE